MIIIENEKQYDKFVELALAGKRPNKEYCAQIDNMVLKIKFEYMGDDFFCWHALMILYTDLLSVDHKFSFISDDNDNLMSDDIFWNYEELLEIKNAGDNGKSNS